MGTFLMRACARTKADAGCRMLKRERLMAWTTPTLIEICIGLEINGYLPAE
jgi:coenzyme PQQ precursor peptide PqqA